MFDALATYNRAPRFSTAFECANDDGVTPATYMIFRDGRPFLMVNAVLKHVLSLIDGFSQQSDFAWTYRLHEAV